MPKVIFASNSDRLVIFGKGSSWKKWFPPPPFFQFVLWSMSSTCIAKIHTISQSSILDKVHLNTFNLESRECRIWFVRYGLNVSKYCYTHKPKNLSSKNYSRILITCDTFIDVLSVRSLNNECFSLCFFFLFRPCFSICVYSHLSDISCELHAGCVIF